MNDNENVSDRELFSELFDNPINPLLVHMVPPFVDVNSPMFHLQLNGEVLFTWRQAHGRPQTVFDLLQRSILPLGYELKASGQERVGNALHTIFARIFHDSLRIKTLSRLTYVCNSNLNGQSRDI